MAATGVLIELIYIVEERVKIIYGVGAVLPFQVIFPSRVGRDCANFNQLAQFTL